MINNEILRRIRDIFEYSDTKLIDIFRLGGSQTTQEQLAAWLTTEKGNMPETCEDPELAMFLNGLIIELRGKKEGSKPRQETVLTNNMIFMKLRIALDLQADEVLDMLAMTELVLSRHELSALFRNPRHKHYRECPDQTLRQFLAGVQLMHRLNE